MDDQNVFLLWSQIRTELLALLGRPSIQLQLTAVVVSLVVAAALGRIAQRQWRARYQNWAEGEAFGKKLLYHFVIQLSSGILTLVFIQLAKAILAGLGARTALVDALLGIVYLYLALKVVLAAAYTIGDADGIQRYQRSLIIPLLIVIIGVQLLNILFGKGRLGNTAVFTMFDNTVTLSALFLITAGFYLWIVGINALGQGILYLATRYGGAEEGSTQAMLTLIRYLLIIVGLAYVLFRLNFNTTTIAAISGGLSVGVGFALSTILSNFVSGILLLFERTINPGDIIEHNGILGIIEMITIRSIRLRTFDNIEMIIPNTEFVTSPFTTYTGKSRHLRLKLPISASYDDDHRHVMKTLLDIAIACPHIMQTPAPDVQLEKFGDFSIDYQLYMWVADPSLIPKVKNELHQAVLDAFAKEGITIPFPTTIEISKQLG